MCTAANSLKIINAEGNFLKYHQERVREAILNVPEKIREINRCSEEGVYVLQDKVTLDANLVLAGIKVKAMEVSIRNIEEQRKNQSFNSKDYTHNTDSSKV